MLRALNTIHYCCVCVSLCAVLRPLGKIENETVWKTQYFIPLVREITRLFSFSQRMKGAFFMIFAGGDEDLYLSIREIKKLFLTRKID